MNAHSSQLLLAVSGTSLMRCQAEWCVLVPSGSYQPSHFQTQTREVPVCDDSFWPFDQALSEVIQR